MRVLVTGGAGFIGSNFIRLLLAQDPGVEIANLDKLTYAGNLENLADVAADPRYRFIRGDICDRQAVARAIEGCQAVVNFAAETHVDRAIGDPASFLHTDILGVYVLLEAARQAGVKRFVQVSTDEVYGPIAAGSAREDGPLNPTNPYSASKAGGELLARSYFATYGFPVLITRGANTFGPYQYPEKLMPLFVTNALEDQPLPVYGDGQQVREWIYVTDHCRAIALVLERGQPGEIYNISTGIGLPNLEVTRLILAAAGKPETLIKHVKDRPGHDRRYSIDSSKMRALGWRPERDFRAALEETVAWYRDHPGWWRKIKSGEFLEYYRRQYGDLAREP
jgi:dTDP-glucose 4,6-dehydratase